MAFEHEKRQALRLLEGIEQGSMSAAESYRMIEASDATLVYFVFSWLRERYGPHHPASEGVLGRLAEVCRHYPAAPRKAKAGSKDMLVPWFEDAYSYRDFDSRDFVSLVVEKLEG